jgi:Protein of unknown function (DUF3987)
MGHADIALPIGRVVPITLYLIALALTGERKSTGDDFAMSPIEQHERELRVNYDARPRVPHRSCAAKSTDREFRRGSASSRFGSAWLGIQDRNKHLVFVIPKGLHRSNAQPLRDCQALISSSPSERT